MLLVFTSHQTLHRASGQPTWHLLLWSWEAIESALLEISFFPFQTQYLEPHICILAVFNCSKLSSVLHQNNSQSHNNYWLKHTSYPKAVNKLWSVIIPSIYHQTMFLWWSGGLLSHMDAPDFHHIGMPAEIPCDRAPRSSLLTRRAGLPACTGALQLIDPALTPSHFKTCQVLRLLHRQLCLSMCLPIKMSN